MTRKMIGFTTFLILSIFLLAAAPQQAASGLNIPWWVWLIVVSVVLLLGFVALLNLDTNSADQKEKKDK